MTKKDIAPAILFIVAIILFFTTQVYQPENSKSESVKTAESPDSRPQKEMPTKITAKVIATPQKNLLTECCTTKGNGEKIKTCYAAAGFDCTHCSQIC